jgi:2-polyprenyl-3-methyl-5-hydroxy-6-metoxy-1,4-benzoquinol methylase
MTTSAQPALRLVAINRCLCGSTDAEEIGAGLDYEYATSPDTFHAHRCHACGLVFLDPRPDISEFQRIYPAHYHSLAFSPTEFGFVHRIRSRLEARRLLRYCRGAPEHARILDIGCGDGFHLDLLARHGPPGWRLEGVDLDIRAVTAARRRGLTVHQGTIEELNLDAQAFDVIWTIQTIEHVAHPDRLLAACHRLLKPGGRLVIVTDNTDSLDFGLFRRRCWGGYHFPRHWHLFNRQSLTRLILATGFELSSLDTLVSPVNWVYSIRNWLVARNGPRWLVERFSLRSPVSLGVFTVLDMVLQRAGRGALLNAVARKPLGRQAAAA